MVDMKETIIKLIEANSEVFENAFLKRFPADEEFAKAESLLGIKLPEELLVIEDCDEFVECIDTISGEIVLWSKYDKAGIVKIADNFYQHFVDKLENAIDNWE